MAKAGWLRVAVSAFLFSCVLAVAPAAGDAIDECFDYADSSWSDRFMTCAGRGGGCSICVGAVVVYKGQDGGGPAPPLGTEFAALLPAPYAGDGRLARSEASGPLSPVGEFVRVRRACSEDQGMFDALDPRPRPAHRHVPRSAVSALQPVPAP